jgi:hypothetical protein
MSDQDESAHLSGQDARAGATPHMTRYILGASLVLVVVAFLVIWWLR